MNTPQDAHRVHHRPQLRAQGHHAGVRIPRIYPPPPHTRTDTSQASLSPLDITHDRRRRRRPGQARGRGDEDRAAQLLPRRQVRGDDGEAPDVPLRPGRAPPRRHRLQPARRAARHQGARDPHGEVSVLTGRGHAWGGVERAWIVFWVGVGWVIDYYHPTVDRRRPRVCVPVCVEQETGQSGCLTLRSYGARFAASRAAPSTWTSRRARRWCSRRTRPSRTRARRRRQARSST